MGGRWKEEEKATYGVYIRAVARLRETRGVDNPGSGDAGNMRGNSEFNFETTHHTGGKPNSEPSKE